jgi:tRNA nucleotidyltransferase/poly(A) polymerase
MSDVRKIPGPGGIPLPPIVDEIRDRIPEPEAYLVGGVVRDAILGRPAWDIDVVLRGSGVEAARSVANSFGAAFFPLDSERGIGRVILYRRGDRYTLDFASLREKTIEADLALRDFTVNAIAVPLRDPARMVDPLHGEADARGGSLRACSPHAVADDPVRAVRAVRLAAQFGFRIEKGTKEQARAGAALIGRVSAERIRDELFRILAGRKIAAAVHSLAALGLLQKILPETAGLAQPPPGGGRDGLWEHTLAALEKFELICGALTGGSAGRVRDGAAEAARERLLRFRPALSEYMARPLCDERPVRGLVFLAAVLHDAAKPETRTVDAAGKVHYLGHEQLGADWALQRALALRFSRDEADFVAKTVRHHMRPMLLKSSGPVTRRAVFRFFRGTGPCGVAVSLFFLADLLAAPGNGPPPADWQLAVETVHSLLEGYFERPAEMIRPAPLLSGDELIAEFGLCPGPQIGELLDALREAQAAGEVNARAEAVALVKRGLGRR